jgi:hypothetical protein
MQVAFLIALKFYKVLRHFVPEDSTAYHSFRAGIPVKGVVGLRCTLEQVGELIAIAQKHCPEAVPQLQEVLEFNDPGIIRR